LHEVANIQGERSWAKKIMEWIERAKRHPTVVVMTIAISAGVAGFKFSDVISTKRTELLTEKIEFYERVDQDSQSIINRLQKEIKKQNNKLGKLQAELQLKNFSGYWKHSWGYLVLYQHDDRVKGTLLDFNGKSFLLDGLVENQKLDFDWVRYSKQNIVEKGAGYFNLQEDKNALQGSWRGSTGVWIAVSASRYRWSIPE